MPTGTINTNRRAKRTPLCFLKPCIVQDMANIAPQVAGTVRAAVYARISRDDEGDMLGVRRQEKDGRALCQQKGWTVAEVFTDDDVSAWNGKVRPQYRRMLAAITAGDIDAVVAYDLDRLHRLPWELEQFFRTCTAAGLTRMATCSGDVDLATSDGQLIARIMGAVAKKSSDDTSRRLKRKFDEKAELGLPHGGRAFGYESDGVTVRRDEAKLLVQAARDVLRGESLNAIARRWNDLGVLTPQRGRQWSGTVVKAVLTNPRHAGLRVNHRQVIGQAAWPAVLDRATHERLVSLLTGDGRRQRVPARRQTFTGLIRCVLCGEALTRDVVRGAISYRCHKAPGRVACGRVTITALPLEALITEAVLQRLDTPALAKARAKKKTGRLDADHGAALADIETRMAEVAERFAAGDIGRREWMAARSVLEKRRTTARDALNRSEKTTALEPFQDRPGALRAAWPSLSSDRRRTIVAALIDRITVSPATRRGPIFDSDRIDVTWRA